MPSACAAMLMASETGSSAGVSISTRSASCPIDSRALRKSGVRKNLDRTPGSIPSAGTGSTMPQRVRTMVRTSCWRYSSWSASASPAKVASSLLPSLRDWGTPHSLDRRRVRRAALANQRPTSAESRDLTEQRRTEDRRGIVAPFGALMPRRRPPGPSPRPDEAEQRIQQRVQLRLGLCRGLWPLSAVEKLHPGRVQGRLGVDFLRTLLPLRSLLFPYTP